MSRGLPAELAERFAADREARRAPSGRMRRDYREDREPGGEGRRPRGEGQGPRGEGGFGGPRNTMRRAKAKSRKVMRGAFRK